MDINCIHSALDDSGDSGSGDNDWWMFGCESSDNSAMVPVGVNGVNGKHGAASGDRYWTIDAGTAADYELDSFSAGPVS